MVTVRRNTIKSHLGCESKTRKTKMAPFPEEIDVFSVPHSRMKELVDVYLRKLPTTDFADQCSLKSLLNELQRTFCEFKSHENIENMYIMHKLESKLKALSIYNSAVCHCHSDNRLSEILLLVEDGYRCCTSKSEMDCINYGLQLQRALRDFTAKFLPHMKEEEEVFQPLLMKYFEYEELKNLKEMVIEQHQHWEECLLNEQLEKFCFETKDGDEEGKEHFSLIPPEVTLKIFGYLSPTDLIRCRGVNRQWKELTFHPSLWRHLDPIQWSKGETSLRSSFEMESSDPEEIFSCKCDKFEPEYKSHSDDDEYEKEETFLYCVINTLLPKVGDAIHMLILRESETLSSLQLHSFLNLCPNLTHLDISYTKISDVAFEGLAYPACLKLTHFDASGCCSFTDSGMFSLAMAWRGLYEAGNCNYRNCCYKPCRKISYKMCASSCRDSMRKLSYNKDCQRHYQFPSALETNRKGLMFLRLSGCHHITDFGLMKIAQMGMVTYLQYLDISGCYLLTGTGLKQMVAQCIKLRPDNLYYCNNITDGPAPLEANGCQNLGSTARFCCSTGQF